MRYLAPVLLLLCAACSAQPVYYAAPGPVATPIPYRAAVEAATAIAQATDIAIATSTAQAAAAFQRDSTSTAVANAATALALTPTAAAIALKMTQESARLTETISARQTQAVVAEARATAQATQTQIAATQTATAQAAINAQRDYAMRVQLQRDSAAKVRADLMAVFLDSAVRAFVIGLVAIFFLWLLSIVVTRYLRAYFLAQQEKAKALIELVRRSGNGLIRIDLKSGNIAWLTDGRLLPPAEPRLEGVKEVPHIPIIANDLPADETPCEMTAALALLDAAIDYQANHPGWPENRIPRWDRLNIGADQWTKAINLIRAYVIVEQGKGTHIAPQFQDLTGLRQQIASGNLAVC